MKIPKTMSTQHPDNVNIPFFAESPRIGGEDEIEEAYYVFSHLGCEEQMWDHEGKEVDDFVVKKLLSKYESFFRKKRLGQELFITLRVPNPSIEKAEAKILFETLESIPRSFDAANLFYKDEIAPIFEVILPMTTSSESLNRIYSYYTDFVIGKEKTPIKKGDITLADWVGEFKPKTINVIPLFEDMEHMLNAHNITKEYLKDKNLEYQRVFLARSDPAMNYGNISALFFNKIALQRLHKLSKDIGVKICPIIGVGSAPFRGNLRPMTVKRIMQEYPSAYTLTIQSAFKYDYSPDEVREAIKILEEREIGYPHEIDENKCKEIIEKYYKEYQRQILELAPAINKLARYVPGRRKRKLHIGLFGYSRNVSGVSLPRVITFTAALYSLGIPPEILGLNVLTNEDINFIKSVYINFENDLRDALEFYNPECEFLSKDLKDTINNLGIDFQINKENQSLTKHINKLLLNNNTDDLTDYIIRCGSLRKFLG